LSFFEELKRRNVFRVAIAYLALAWLLTEVSGTLLPAFGVPDWVFRFVVIALALGFVPVLVFSWVYEVTPEGVKREKDIVRDTSITHLTAKRLDWLTIGLIVVALGFIVVDRMWLETRPIQTPEASTVATGDTVEGKPAGPELPADSIAVLPFANRSANPDDVFFVDGIHDDLLTYVSQIGSLKVISRTSVMEYRDTLKKIPEIARELGVAHVLEGGVQRAGDQVRINVQLIDARSDDHVWSSIYDRQLTAGNIFAIQSEIAGAIAAALRATLTPEAQQRIASVPTGNLEALEAYFIGRQQMAKRTVASLQEAIEQFERAAALDPEFALAHVELANALRLHGSYAGISPEQWEERRRRYRSEVEAALRLDPLLAEAHTALAFLKRYEGDDAATEAAFRRAIELNPNYASAYQWYGEWLGYSFPDRIDQALDLSRKAVSLDPLSAIINNDYGENLQIAGRLEEALAYYQKAIDFEPEFAVGYRRIAGLKVREFGQIDEGIKAIRQAFAIDPNWGTADWLGRLYLNLGDPQQAATWRDRAVDLAPGGLTPDSVWLLQLYLGDDELAEEALLKKWNRDPRDAFALYFLAEIYLRTGRADEARASYERGYPEFFKPGGPEIGPDRPDRETAIELAAVLMQSGDSELAQRLLNLSQPARAAGASRSPSDLVLLDARIQALRGDRKLALTALRKGVDRGWREWAWVILEHDPALQSLRDTPEFQAIRAEVEADLVRQLERVRFWETSGQLAALPPVPPEAD
jgi:TolB-like protein/Tfp pilus assembly protein PilF